MVAPVPGPESQLPSVLARVVAFTSILIGGVASGLIGYAFAELGGFEGALRGLFAVGGALVGAGGVAVVAVLTLRAFGEWQTVREAPATTDRATTDRATTDRATTDRATTDRGDGSDDGVVGPRR